MPFSGRSTKLRITFARECLGDFDKIVTQVCESYDLRYAGILEGSVGSILFIQSFGKDVRMYSSRIRKICEKSGVGVVDISTFQQVTGVPLMEQGLVRSTGRPITKSRDELVLPLGREDVSHITVDILSDIVGTEDEVLERMNNRSRRFTEDYLRDLIDERWTMTRKRYRAKLRGDNERKQVDDDLYVFDPDQFLEENKPGYYACPDDEENVKMKDKLRNEFLLDTEAALEHVNFVDEFEKLLYKQSSNSNVKASRSHGYFHYLGGDGWVSNNVSEHYFDVVIRARVSVILDLVDKLTMSCFLKKQILRLVRAYPKIGEVREERVRLVGLSILNAQNQRRGLKRACPTN